MRTPQFFHRRGVDVSLYGRIGAKVTVEGLVPTPVFRNDIFLEAAHDPAVWAMENFHAINDAFLADLSALPTETFSGEDLIYLPNLLQNQLHGVARWLRGLPSDRRPAVAVMLRYLNHAMDYVQTRANKELIALYYRFAARALQAVQPRALLCADTRELAAAYRQITGLPVLELPNPMDVAPLLAGAPERVRGSAASPLIVYQGHTSPLRGFHFLPDMIDRCSKLSPRPRFAIQVQNREGAATAGLGATLTRLDRIAATPGSGVRLVEGALSSEDYYGLLSQADIVLLPYAPTFYGVGSSGVFTESASVGKVVVVALAGSWCPNCHDEAPFLAELYRKYQSKGLEIVSLSFEEEAQKAKGYARLLAFNKRYGVTYPVVLAGDQADVAEKVPQIHNLNSFPTTIFLGKDGLVRGVHAGFAGAASGAFHETAKEEITATVERLLAESTTARAK